MSVLDLKKPLSAAAIGSAIALSIPQSANASDHSSELIKWNGLYAGAVLGLVLGNSTSTCAPGAPLGSFDCGSTQTRAFDLDDNGLAGGVQVGYNVDLKKVVLGVEADFMFADLDEEDIFAAKSASTEMDWMSTIRGRVGYQATENMLVFGTGGVAFAKWHDRYVSSSTTLVDNDDVRTGYAVGGGIELANATGPRFKIEYLFADFGSESTTTAAGSVINFDHEVQTIRLGVNFPLQ